MYEVYGTEAITLSTTPSGESDLYATFYTKEYGRIGAIVPAARKESSKHRYAIQDHALTSIRFILGKRGYRIIGTSPEAQLTLYGSIDVQKSVMRIISIVNTLIHGQEQDQKLFSLLDSSLRRLSEKIEKEQRTIYELFVLVRLVEHLGYLTQSSAQDVPESFFSNNIPSELDLLHIEKNKTLYTEMVNKSVFESQL
jgi:DNA repair protein RecO